MLSVTQTKMERTDIIYSQPSNAEAIHSGHFMVSKLDDSSSDDEVTELSTIQPKIEEKSFNSDPEPVSMTGEFVLNPSTPAANMMMPMSVVTLVHPQQHQSGYDFKNACHEAGNLNCQFGAENSPPSFGIDDSLSKLMECLTIAYHGKITSPKWNQFRGIKVPLKQKIRLNNIIWREYHMQFVKRKRPIVVQFASALSENHTNPEAVILEGKYWKRKIQVIRNEYNHCRQLLRSLSTVSRRPFNAGLSNERMEYITGAVNSLTPANAGTAGGAGGGFRKSTPLQRSASPPVNLEDFMNFDDLDFFLNEPMIFPNPRDMAQLGYADIIQPGLLQLQPTCEEFAHLDFFPQFSQFSHNNMIMGNNFGFPHTSQQSQQQHQQQQHNTGNAFLPPREEANMVVEITHSLHHNTMPNPTGLSEAMEVCSSSSTSLRLDNTVNVVPNSSSSSNNTTTFTDLMQADKSVFQQVEVFRDQLFTPPLPTESYVPLMGSPNKMPYLPQQQQQQLTAFLPVTSSTDKVSMKMMNRGNLEENIGVNAGKPNVFVKPATMLRSSINKNIKSRPPVAIAPAPSNRLRGGNQWVKSSPSYTPRQFSSAASVKQQYVHMVTPSGTASSTGLMTMIAEDESGNNQTPLSSATMPSSSSSSSMQHHHHQQQQLHHHPPSLRSVDGIDADSSLPFTAPSSIISSSSSSQRPVVIEDDVDRDAHRELSGTRFMMGHRLPSTFTITCGFQLLQSLLSQSNGGGSATIRVSSGASVTSSKASKAALLHQAAEQIRRHKERLRLVEEETARLQAEVDALQGNIGTSCAQLPATGVVVNSQRAQQGQAWLKEYILLRSERQWKFYPFGLFLELLFDSYNTSISTSNRSTFRHSVFRWLEQQCSLVKLRGLVTESMCRLNAETSILENPMRVAGEINELVRQSLLQMCYKSGGGGSGGGGGGGDKHRRNSSEMTSRPSASKLSLPNAFLGNQPTVLRRRGSDNTPVQQRLSHLAASALPPSGMRMMYANHPGSSNSGGGVGGDTTSSNLALSNNSIEAMLTGHQWPLSGKSNASHLLDQHPSTSLPTIALSSSSSSSNSSSNNNHNNNRVILHHQHPHHHTHPSQPATRMFQHRPSFPSDVLGGDGNAAVQLRFSSAAFSTAPQHQQQMPN